MSTERNIPKLRFPGFTEPWEQRKLGEVSESYSGGTPSVGNKSYYGGSIPFIRSAEINSESTELFLTEEGLTNSSARMVSKGDILYALYGATSGETGRSRINGAINQAILAILPHDGYDSEFLMQWLRKSKQNITDIYLQGGQGNLSGAIVKALEVNFPSLAEQWQIGNYFQSIDKLITLHQRKLEHVNDLKKTMLQKMFPKNGQEYPELRFPGFTEPWEQRKLDDVLEVLKDGTHGTHADVDNGVYLLSAKNIKNGCVSIDESDRQISFEEYEKIHTKFKLKNGDVLMTIVGTIGEAAILESAENITFQRSVAFLRPSNELQNSFLLQTIYTKSFQKELDNRKATGAQPGIYLGEVAQIPIMIPTNLSEQEKISSYFDNLDNLITLHQRELEHLKLLKKGMLQQMFV